MRIIQMLKLICDWFENNIYAIAFIGFIIIMVITTNQDIKNTQIDCTEKCEEVGYSYFDSERERFFGLKGEDCKCKDGDNNIIDIK